MKTWKQKIGKKLMQHVKETTERGTLAEVKRNIAANRASEMTCWECVKIAQKLNLTGSQS